MDQFFRYLTMADKAETLAENNQDNEFVIREAKPDLEEGLVFAELFDEASEGFFSSVLGSRMNEILAEAYIKLNNEYSFENASVIEYEGTVVGMVSGYTHSEKKEFTRNILGQFSSGARLNIISFTLIGRILSRFLGPRGQGDYYLQAIALKSEMRGKGLGQKLLLHSVETANKKGARTLSLDVSSKNTRAIKSYRRFGMRESSSWPNLPMFPSVFTRMTKDL